MITRYRVLAGRIHQEIAQLELARGSADRHWRRSLTALEDQDAYLSAAALALHGFYTGVERLMELIARDVDGGVLGGESWHAELLQQMSMKVPGIRPAVISTETAAWLDEYRKFRHLVRNVYAVVLLPDRMASLVDTLPSGWGRFRDELLAFADHLTQL